jgi:hypothetical protein
LLRGRAAILVASTIEEFGDSRVRLAATLRSVLVLLLLLVPVRGTATDARVLLEPEPEFGFASWTARLFGVMRVRSPDEVMRLPPSLAGRDAVVWLVVP